MERDFASNNFSTAHTIATDAPIFIATPQIWMHKLKLGSMDFAFQSRNASPKI